MKNMPLIFFLFLGIPFVSSQITEQDRSVARLYAHFALEADENGRKKDFEALIAKGLEYDGNNPDLLYFKGRLLLKKKDYIQGLSCFEKARRSSESPTEIMGGDILDSMAESLYVLGQNEQLLRLYYSAAELERHGRELLFYTAQALKALNQNEEALKLAEEGLNSFQDQRFLILLAAWTGPGEWKRVLAGSIKRQGILYPDLMAREILNKSDSSLMASLYVEQFNDINSFYFRDFILKLPQAGEISFFSPERTWPLKVFLHWLKDRPQELLLRELYDVIKLDSGAKGLADIEIRKTPEGWLWQMDQDGDGDHDFMLQWAENGKLESLYSFSDYEQRSYRYYDYPFLDSISMEGPGRSRREYLFLPGIYPRKISNVQDKGNPGSLMLAILQNSAVLTHPLEEERQFLKLCFSLIESVQKGQLYTFREYTVAGGQILRFREDSNFDGCFDRRVILSDWLPIAGARDLDGDGEEELKEKYINGRFAGFEYEGEASRLEEFHDLWSRQRFQLWDFSKDDFYEAFLKRSDEGSWEEYILSPKAGD